MGRLVRWFRLFGRRNPRTLSMLRNWSLPVLLVLGVLSVVHSTVQANTAPTASQLEAYLDKNNLFVFSEARAGYSQVFYRYRNEFIQVTSGAQNHTWAVADDNYIAWQEEEPAGGQLFLHDILTGSTTQITTEGVNVEPALNGNTLVWRKFVNESWQIYFYNGFGVTRITDGPTSNFHPSSNGNKIIYAEQVATDQWRVHSYDVRTRENTVIKEGNQSSAGHPRFTDDGSIATDSQAAPLQD